ncbi:MAG TPA: M18 family aminopeptidase [Candidatus Faecousia intestinavium]|nr:M18 family aminopeptidase [Candidatus Faecousia intestinavium]
MNKRIEDLCRYLDQAHSVYHAQKGIADRLEQQGYIRLPEQNAWQLKAGEKYYVTRGGTALVAFRIPDGTPRGFMMSASHSDRPGFKLKENGNLTGIYDRLGTERYGGAILSTWLDRPLSIAGRVTVRTEDGVENRLIDLDRDLLLIPNAAIHMNRKVNEGYAWNLVSDLTPLVGGADSGKELENLLEQEAGGEILGRDLYLYVRQKASVWGVREEYISSAGLDDLECVWGCTQGFLEAKPSQSVPVLSVFDSEEVGSASVQGAGSTFLEDVLRRICDALGWPLEQMLAQSFLISADNAHALHPNHPEYADPANAPVMGQGVVLKFHANLSYCTDGLAAGIFRSICKKAQVPVQSYHNRADIPGGSTLGRISLAHVSVPTADIGLPQLAMHSCYETAATADAEYLAQAMTEFYGSCLEVEEDSWKIR